MKPSESPKFYRRLLYPLTWVMVITTIVFLSLVLTQVFQPERESKWLMAILGVIIGALSSFYLAFFIRTLTKHPATIKAALVGDTGSGKTVFLTIMFRELQLSEEEKIAFQPYGRETIEYVASNLNILASRKWLLPTKEESLFTFRANAKIQAWLFDKRYTIEIGDYAGEHIEEFHSSSERWLHRTEYFDYVVGADIVLFVVDSEKYRHHNDSAVKNMQNQLIAAFQVLIDDKGLPPDRQLEIPVCLLVLKADVLDSVEVDEGCVLDSLEQLIRICRDRCRFFEIFFISAVGSVDNKGKPPEKILPRNITSPMFWSLKRVNI